MPANKPTRQILIKHKEQQSIQDFAAMLEKIAQNLREKGKFTFVQGTEQIEVSPAELIKAEYEYVVNGDKHEFEIEFEWYEGARSAGKMRIE